MSEPNHSFVLPNRVDITVSRWGVRIDIVGHEPNAETTTFIASADRFYTMGDSIWFGTPDEYERWEG